MHQRLTLLFRSVVSNSKSEFKYPMGVVALLKIIKASQIEKKKNAMHFLSRVKDELLFVNKLIAINMTYKA